VESLYSVYNDIAERTKGDIYIGVVGPVRTGKSTFIKKFMETLWCRISRIHMIKKGQLMKRHRVHQDE
jgi:uridine kinase